MKPARTTIREMVVAQGADDVYPGGVRALRAQPATAGAEDARGDGSRTSRPNISTSRARLSEPGAFAISPEIFRNAQQFELEFVRAGGLMAAGVDPTGNGGALPGFGDQRNYELLIEAGFTPVEAIRIMTLNGATILGEDKRLGSITAGKLADLVVIKGDPIARPAEIRNVAVVFKDGVGYDPAKLIEACRGLVGIR